MSDRIYIELEREEAEAMFDVLRANVPVDPYYGYERPQCSARDKLRAALASEESPERFKPCGGSGNHDTLTRAERGEYEALIGESYVNSGFKSDRLDELESLNHEVWCADCLPDCSPESVEGEDWPTAIFIFDCDYSDWTELEICDPDTPGARKFIPAPKESER